MAMSALLHAASGRSRSILTIVVLFAILLAAIALPKLALADCIDKSAQCAKYTNGPPTTLGTIQATGSNDAYSGMYGYDTGGFINTYGAILPSFSRGTGRDFSFNNKSATAEKDKSKSRCQGYASDPVEVDDGAKLLSIPLFQMPGEMGLKYVLYYGSVTSSSVWAYNPWRNSLDYDLDLYCGFTNPNISCNQVTLWRPDGSSLSFTGNHAAFGNFPEIGGGGLATLVHNADGTWTLHDEDSTVQTYSAYGFL